ncbi:MAG: methylmalonyl-CoA mutase, partial [Chloroflexota bacterium]
EVERIGGVVRGIETGYFQREIARSAERQQREIESGERIVVGINRFRDPDGEAPPPIQRIDPEAERRQVDRVRRVRAERDPGAWARALDRLEDCARGGENVVPAILEAVRAYATLGEISDRLRRTWGEHRELVAI